MRKIPNKEIGRVYLHWNAWHRRIKMKKKKRSQTAQRIPRKGKKKATHARNRGEGSNSKVEKHRLTCVKKLEKRRN